MAVRFDDPWARHGGYPTVLLDGTTYRMYYKAGATSGADKDAGQCTAYAESADGIHWEKPSLGMFEVAGEKQNNVTHFGNGPTSHNFTPFIDRKPGVPDDQRYKALAGTKETGLIAFASADGIHWRQLFDGPVFPITTPETRYDSQNVSFWSEHEKCYLCYYRIFHNGIRTIVRAVSDDFQRWRDDARMGFSGTQLEQLYINQTHPYFRAPHIYVALAARFMPGRQVLTDEEGSAFGVGSHQGQGYWHDVSEGVLLTSRGGWQYDRTFMEGFIRPGRDRRNWTSRCNYPALGVVPTGSDEMSLYVTRHNQQPSGHIARMTLRVDGFASLNAPYAGGEAVTKTIIFRGDELVLNYATGAAGHVLVELQDEAGVPLPEFSLGKCTPLIGDEVERAVSWTGGTSVGSVQGRPIRMRIAMKDADVYSFQFRIK